VHAAGDAATAQTIAGLAPPSPEGLDACCLGGATYDSVVKGFELRR